MYLISTTLICVLFTPCICTRGKVIDSVVVIIAVCCPNKLSLFSCACLKPSSITVTFTFLWLRLSTTPTYQHTYVLGVIVHALTS